MTKFVSNMILMSATLNGDPGYAAVLIDVVDSRRHTDRLALQAAITEAATAVNGRTECLDPLTPTVGDELQATYTQPATAIRAVVELRLELRGIAELRAGIGWGDIIMHDAARTPFGQDGSAWWSAREALDQVAESTARSGYAARMGIRFAAEGPLAEPLLNEPTMTTRTGLPSAAPLAIQTQSTMQAMLALFDRALASVDAVESQIVLGDLAGHSTDAIAGRLGLTASAVSQRRGRNHLRELVAALRLVDTAV